MIQVSHLTKVYGPRTAIDDLNFEIGKGEIVGFLGPNGAGKTTTMKILTGFMPATDGKVVVAGYDVFEKPLEVKRNVGYLPENPPVYLEMRVRDYLEFAGKIQGVPSAQISKAVDSAIEKAGLGEVRTRLIGNLSKGFRQRVGLAQAVIHNPQVLILDEPTVGLDPKQIIEIRGLIKALGGDHTIILSSHILPEVTATCERIIVINTGRIVAQDTLENLTMRSSKGLTYTLVVKKPSSEGIQAIRALPEVRNLAVDGPTLLIDLQPNGQDVRDRIAETAVAKGMGILEFSAKRVSLEEIFLQLITGEQQ